MLIGPLWEDIHKQFEKDYPEELKKRLQTYRKEAEKGHEQLYQKVISPIIRTPEGILHSIGQIATGGLEYLWQKGKSVLAQFPSLRGRYIPFIMPTPIKTPEEEKEKAEEALGQIKAGGSELIHTLRHVFYPNVEKDRITKAFQKANEIKQKYAGRNIYELDLLGFREYLALFKPDKLKNLGKLKEEEIWELIQEHLNYQVQWNAVRGVHPLETWHELDKHGIPWKLYNIYHRMKVGQDPTTAMSMLKDIVTLIPSSFFASKTGTVLGALFTKFGLKDTALGRFVSSNAVKRMIHEGLTGSYWTALSGAPELIKEPTEESFNNYVKGILINGVIGAAPVPVSKALSVTAKTTVKPALSFTKDIAVSEFLKIKPTRKLMLKAVDVIDRVKNDYFFGDLSLKPILPKIVNMRVGIADSLTKEIPNVVKRIAEYIDSNPEVKKVFENEFMKWYCSLPEEVRKYYASKGFTENKFEMLSTIQKIAILQDRGLLHPERINPELKNVFNLLHSELEIHNPVYLQVKDYFTRQKPKSIEKLEKRGAKIFRELTKYTQQLQTEQRRIARYVEGLIKSLVVRADETQKTKILKLLSELKGTDPLLRIKEYTKILEAILSEKDKVKKNISKYVNQIEKSYSITGQYVSKLADLLTTKPHELTIEQLQDFINLFRATKPVKELRQYIKQIKQDFVDKEKTFSKLDRVAEQVEKRYDELGKILDNIQATLTQYKFPKEVQSKLLKDILESAKLIEKDYKLMRDALIDTIRYLDERETRIRAPEFAEFVSTMQNFLKKVQELDYEGAKAEIEKYTTLKAMPLEVDRAVKRLIKFTTTNPLFTKYLKETTKTPVERIKKAQQLLEKIKEKVNQFYQTEFIKKDLFERLTLAKDFVGALRRRNERDVPLHIASLTDDEIADLFRRTAIQPYEFDALFDFYKIIENKYISPSYVEAVLTKTLSRYNIHPITISRVAHGVQFPHLIKTELTPEQHLAIQTALGELITGTITEEQFNEFLMQVIPQMKQLRKNLEDLLSGVPNKQSIISTIITSLYSPKKPEGSVKDNIIRTPYSMALLSRQARNLYEIGFGREEVKPYSKFINWFVIFPKLIMLSMSPFHAISLLKSYTYSTGDVEFATKNAADFARHFAKYSANILSGFKLGKASEVAKEYIETNRKLATDELMNNVLPKLREMGMDIRDLDITLQRTLDINWIKKEQEVFGKALRHLAGDTGITGMIFEGLYSYLKVRDLRFVVEDAYKKFKARPEMKAKILEELKKNISDINWKYGGLPMFLTMNPSLRQALRVLLLAPDWQISLIQQFALPLSTFMENRLRYMTSMFAYNYLMYYMEQNTAEGRILSPEEAMERFITRLTKGENPFDILFKTNSYLIKVNFFAYEKEPFDWIHSIAELLIHGDISDLSRTFFNRTSVPLRFLSEIASQSRQGNTIQGLAGGLLANYPYLIMFPLPITTILNSREMYGLSFSEAMKMTLPQMLTIRSYVVPASNILHEMIKQDKWDSYSYWMYVYKAMHDFTEAYISRVATNITGKKVREPSWNDIRKGITTSVIQQLVNKDKEYRRDIAKLVALLEAGKYDEFNKSMIDLTFKISKRLQEWLANKVPEEDLETLPKFVSFIKQQTVNGKTEYVIDPDAIAKGIDTVIGRFRKKPQKYPEGWFENPASEYLEELDKAIEEMQGQQDYAGEEPAPVTQTELK